MTAQVQLDNRDLIVVSDISSDPDRVIQLLSRDEGAFLLVDKPYSYTSHSAVHTLRRILTLTTGKKWVKVGHSGTLDPLATGLLILASGKMTKSISQFSGLPKTYRIELRLGISSPSFDLETPITVINTDTVIDDSTITGVLLSYIGSHSQLPPMYSAVKHRGKPLYKHARKGRSIEIEPRIVTITSIDNISIQYPYISFTADVSKGTYIRSLVDDIGKKLGVGAVLTNLQRTAIGDFTIESAVPLSVLHSMRQQLTEVVEVTL